ncbi:uncharacterized protein LOC108740084 [Agrilus planipennis]|uniref:Uncharacterized protein LOC108740084 n=1 Tax=Agrilus planipennis TaxID=224129 RepID=A0A1W4XBI1_AGRPL|nr:uncharacterized protein LOC108740084 [Agrilus planipennis]
MKTILFLCLIACIGLSNAKISFPNSIIDNISGAGLNKSIEYIKGFAAKFDPISVANVNKSSFTGISVKAKKLDVSGFSNYSLSDVNVGLNSFGFTVTLHSIKASGEDLGLHSLLGNDVEIKSLELEFKGIQYKVEFSWIYLLKFRLRKLNVLPHVDGGSAHIVWHSNDHYVDFTTDDAAIQKVNRWLVKNQKNYSAVLLNHVNSILNTLQS